MKSPCLKFRWNKYMIISTWSPGQTHLPGSVLNQWTKYTTVAILHSLSLVVSAFLLLIERKYGYSERDFVAGVRPMEMLLAYLLFMLLATLLQDIITILVSYYILGLTFNGSPIDALFVLTLQSFQGISFGLLFALLFSQQYIIIVSIIESKYNN